jgi:hypothetical protein
MSLVLGGFDVVGDEDEGVAILGRGGRGRARLAHRGRAGKVKVPTPKWMNAASSQGVSRPQEEMDFLPFDSATIAASEAAQANVAAVLIAYPQRPFRGERLIMGAIGSDGNDYASAVVIDPAIYVGAVQIGASQGATPITAFGANAFGVRLSVPAAGQGTQIKIYVRAIVVPVDVALTITATIIGRAMR